MSSTVFKKVVWAVDAFEPVGKSQLRAADAIQCLRQRCNLTVYPVHILSPAELNLSAEFAGPAVTQYKPAAERALNHRISTLGVTRVELPVILTQSASSTSRSADMLTRYAENLEADLILVSTHGRTGVSRIFLGSFAETLLLRSRIPVMVVGPHMRPDCNLDHILFPTEFGEPAKQIFKRVVCLAREFKVRMTLFHAIPRPIEPVYQSGVYLLGSPWIPVHEYYTRELRRHERHARGWANWAKNQGVQIDIKVDTETTNIADSILKLVKNEKIGWVAMAAQNGPIASALLGSITRQVIRNVECPVWVLRWPRSEKGVSRLSA